ncbi:uncharacterized protein N7482_009482 [Penicillium canariense]|uniref:Uncharacterized protein n=1 Tax=Penicillium canariense TaxID=189055 RepID=A0A9W9HQG9_9EURO|nr:uncharacterized protein N7482_009482 [Penicillium canariense]KAJ5153004.1 hypothetical protein N7482_009482 [Penicillium canariense]
MDDSLHESCDMGSTQHAPVSMEDESQQTGVDDGDMCGNINELLKEIQALSEGRPGCEAQVASAIKTCHSLEAIMSRHLSEKQRLEEVIKRIQTALLQERMEYQNLQQRCVDQEITLSHFRRAFPILQEEMGGLIGTWETLGFQGVYKTV